MRAREAAADAAERLAAAGCPSPLVDAEWLVAHVIDTSRSALYADDRPLSDHELERLETLVARRGTREPLAYVLGEWGFRRLTLTVDPRVLIPRPETEVVVERCLALLESVRDPRVLDIGVGSGAMALAIADERPDARVVGTDFSADALDVADVNRRRVEVDGRVVLVHGDLTGGAEGPFDLVVSNPPYVRASEIDSLDPEVRREPREALVGEGRHEAVAREALRVLRPGAWLVLEAADGQAGRVAEMLERLGYVAIRVSPDLAGRDRVVEGRRS